MHKAVRLDLVSFSPSCLRISELAMVFRRLKQSSPKAKQVLAERRSRECLPESCCPPGMNRELSPGAQH